MTIDLTKPLKPQLLDSNGPVCLIFQARLMPVGDTDRFQPAGFPEVGHVIYDAPRIGSDGRKLKEKVCIVDSPASMANHLEKVCLAGDGANELHADLNGLPFVVCVTDRDFETKDGAIVIKEGTSKDMAIVSTLTEGHRLASDYFLDAQTLLNGTPTSETLREKLRKDFKIIEVKKDKTYFIPPTTWWSIYKTIFNLDPNSLVHGVMFAKEQIKISRMLTAHMEAFGAARVGRSGVKFDRLGKTTSGQPIFSVDEETAEVIRATFNLDLGLLRSYGRGEDGLNNAQKQLLLDLALWKIAQLVKRPFKYRTQCFLKCEGVTVATEDGLLELPNPEEREAAGTADSSDDSGAAKVAAQEKASNRVASGLFKTLNLPGAITSCDFPTKQTNVYYPADELFKAGKETEAASDDNDDEDTEEES